MKPAILRAVLLTAVLWENADAGGWGSSARSIRGRVDDLLSLRSACPDYVEYSKQKHGPYSEGPLKLSFQRPVEECRTFKSSSVEDVIEDVTSRMTDKDLAQIFRNAFPNTLDTTVRWHIDGNESKGNKKKSKTRRDGSVWDGPQSFIVTGDINAEWLRDSTNQLAQYQKLTGKDPAIKSLILGAINTQAEFVIQSPYCNAFQPPPASGIPPIDSEQDDTVHPAYEPSVVFECKYELDSVASFLALGNQYYDNTQSDAFLTERWYKALDAVLNLVDKQSESTFDENGQYVRNEYTFLRQTNLGTETLNLKGIGNPLNNGTGLVRSAFRPSDDASILGFFTPPNAMISVEFKKTAAILEKAGKKELAEQLRALSKRIEDGIWENAVVKHKKWGDVFAFEIDGYGGNLFMDDANLPSLLSLPAMGFVDKDNEVYQNTRKMILSKQGNPFYLTGTDFHGIGGPHIGVENAWPMAVLMRAQTSDDDDEIMESINMVRDSSLLGLIHESVDVNNVQKYTRSWFAWANSVFAQTILDIAERKPHLIFGKGAKPYTVSDSKKGDKKA